jgi:hypothetical protein
MRNRAQTFMKQDDFSRAPAAADHALNLKAVPLHSQMEGIFLVACFRLHGAWQRPLPPPVSAGPGSFSGYSRCLRPASNLQDIVSYMQA